MRIREPILDVLALQARYTSENSPEMRDRGRLIRAAIPDALSDIGPLLAVEAEIETDDFLIQGKDGVGRKSEIPWVRFASKARSPRATDGWYVVFLFRKDGAGVYLALGHGSTTFQGGSLVARSDEDLANLIKWSRSSLAKVFADNPRLVFQVDLGSASSLALAYEKSCAAAFYYQADLMPSDQELARDLRTMARLLGQLYRAERFGQTPISLNPEVRDAAAASYQIARPGAARGQGFSLTAAERKAVELRAMDLATRHLASLGYAVRDVSATESFDLVASSGATVLKVEVKGTTGGLGSILLTANEVEIHKDAFPNNALIVVHSINLTGDAGAPRATNGVLRAWLPWALEGHRLRGITYSYDLGDEPSVPISLAVAG